MQMQRAKNKNSHKHTQYNNISLLKSIVSHSKYVFIYGLYVQCSVCEHYTEPLNVCIRNRLYELRKPHLVPEEIRPVRTCGRLGQVGEATRTLNAPPAFDQIQYYSYLFECKARALVFAKLKLAALPYVKFHYTLNCISKQVEVLLEYVVLFKSDLKKLAHKIFISVNSYAGNF